MRKSYKYKTVQELIDDKVSRVNKMAQDLKIEDKQEQEEEIKEDLDSSIMEDIYNQQELKKGTDVEEEQAEDDEQDEKLETKMTNYLLNMNQEESISLRKSLQERLENASTILNVAREAAMRATEEDLKKYPVGLFNEVKDDEKGPYFDDIISFLGPFLINAVKHRRQAKTFPKVLDLMRKHMKDHEEEKKKLMEKMNVKKLVVPYISLDLPGEVILTYNKLEEDDPLVAVFRLHPIIGEEVYKFAIFLDRYDTNKESICSLVWSTIDNMMVCLPMIGLNPYPICWECEKSFGTLTCSKCKVAKYCSKECQIANWKTSHKIRCLEIEHYVSQHKQLEFT